LLFLLVLFIQCSPCLRNADVFVNSTTVGRFSVGVRVRRTSKRRRRQPPRSRRVLGRSIKCNRAFCYVLPRVSALYSIRLRCVTRNSDFLEDFLVGCRADCRADYHADCHPETDRWAGRSARRAIAWCAVVAWEVHRRIAAEAELVPARRRRAAR
jgi:hypothetical protein